MSARRDTMRGQTLGEYLAVIAVVLALILVLTTLRAHRPGKVPFDPVRHIGALVAPEPRPLRPPRPPRVRPPRPPRTAPVKPRAPRPVRPVISVPKWMVGR